MFRWSTPPLVEVLGSCRKDDWAAWTTFTTKVGGPTQVVGDDLTVPGTWLGRPWNIWSLNRGLTWFKHVQTLLNVSPLVIWVKSVSEVVLF